MKWESFLYRDPNLISLRGMYARARCARRVLDHKYPHNFSRCTLTEVRSAITLFSENAIIPQDKTAALAILELAKSAQNIQILKTDLIQAINLSNQKISTIFLPAVNNLIIGLGLRSHSREVKACVDELLSCDPDHSTEFPSFDAFARKCLWNKFL